MTLVGELVAAAGRDSDVASMAAARLGGDDAAPTAVASWRHR